MDNKDQNYVSDQLINAGVSAPPAEEIPLVEFVKDLAEARRQHEVNKRTLWALQAEFNAIPKVAELINTTALCNTKVSDLSTLVTNRAILEYLTTNNKKPCAGISITEETVLTYTEEEALEWCKANLPAALKLDKSFFEKHAKGVKNTAPISFVIFSKKNAVSKSQDLDQFYPPESEVQNERTTSDLPDQN